MTQLGNMFFSSLDPSASKNPLGIRFNLSFDERVRGALVESGIIKLLARRFVVICESWTESARTHHFLCAPDVGQVHKEGRGFHAFCVFHKWFSPNSLAVSHIPRAVWVAS